MYDQVSHLEEGFTPETLTCAPGPHCGSRDFVSELTYSLDTKLHPPDISYKAFAPLWGTEDLDADISRGCGTIIRAFVKNTNCKWIQK
jgi:hypothetical protein